MKTLPTSTHRHGVYYSLVRREGSIAMYSLRYTPCGPIVGFDVGRVAVIPSRTFKGQIIETYEQFPLSEQFGTSWWSWTSRAKADQCFTDLLKQGAAHGN